MTALALEKRFEDANPGDCFEFKKHITRELIAQFAQMTGDNNPLHVDPDFAKEKGYPDVISHGMLAASMFSALIGMFCPGRNALYLSQTIEFRSNIPADSEITVRGEVLKKYDSLKIVSLKTEIFCLGKLAVSGEAKAKFI